MTKYRPKSIVEYKIVPFSTPVPYRDSRSPDAGYSGETLKGLALFNLGDKLLVVAMPDEAFMTITQNASMFRDESGHIIVEVEE